MEENWKDIPGYEGLYQVSDMGRVKSFPRRGNYKIRILKPRLSGKNRRKYYTVLLSKNNIPKTITIHQLVAIAFLGHIPDGMNSIVSQSRSKFEVVFLFLYPLEVFLRLVINCKLQSLLSN